MSDSYVFINTYVETILVNIIMINDISNSNKKIKLDDYNYNEEIKSDQTCKYTIPPDGTPVNRKIIRRAGQYLLGPKLGSSPVRCMFQCLGRKENTDEFYTIKILMLKDSSEEETQDDRQGKLLMHTEYSLLSMLSRQEGIIKVHGLFKVFETTLFVLFEHVSFIIVGFCIRRTAKWA